MSRLRLGIVGCTGRTGSAVLRLAAADPAFQVVAAITRADDPRLGQDAGRVAGIEELGIPIAAGCAAACDVLIEFSTPGAVVQWAEWCAQNGVGLVSGTTGLTAEQRATLAHAAERVPVLWSPNMSVGVNLLLAVVGDLAARLGVEWDVEIAEAHHRHKVDAPSGTAKALLEAICRARGQDPQQAGVFGRSGACGPRRPGEIGVHALRLGENVGEHEVTFASASETLTLHHRALSRDTFAAGALQAARWLAGQPAGLYGMGDVLEPGTLCPQ